MNMKETLALHMRRATKLEGVKRLVFMQKEVGRVSVCLGSQRQAGLALAPE